MAYGLICILIVNDCFVSHKVSQVEKQTKATSLSKGATWKNKREFLYHSRQRENSESGVLFLSVKTATGLNL